MPLLKPLASFLGLLLLLYGGACAWLFLSQRRLIFMPDRTLESTPLDAGIPYEDVWIPVGDGQIHGWWLPNETGLGLTFLYLHGNAANISQNLVWALALRNLGASVLMIDYRGYGLSSGPFPSETRLYEDALAAWDFLRQEKGIPPEEIVMYGHSMGGAVAVELASYVPQGGGLIVESSFTSMADMAQRSGYATLFPVEQLLTQRFDSINKLPSVSMPVLYIHGQNDTSVPATMSQQLYKATQAPKAIWLVPNAKHNDVVEQAGGEFQQQILQFLNRHVLIQR
jgi:fermentation-respiration switch protein FrsA (DUF1100 family)